MSRLTTHHWQENECLPAIPTAQCPAARANKNTNIYLLLCHKVILWCTDELWHYKLTSYAYARNMMFSLAKIIAIHPTNCSSSGGSLTLEASGYLPRTLHPSLGVTSSSVTLVDGTRHHHLRPHKLSSLAIPSWSISS